jgi:hypothetical protein
MTDPSTRSGGGCRGPVLQLMPVCAKLGLNKPVIRWMSV